MNYSCPIELKRIGIEKFIEHYDNIVNKSRSEIVEYYVSHKSLKMSESGAKIRAGYIIKIMENKTLLMNCLNYVVFKANKVDFAIKAKAREILSTIE